MRSRIKFINHVHKQTTPCLEEYTGVVDHIRTLLPKALRRRGLEEQAKASLVVFQAQKWIEKELPHVSRELQAVKYKDEVLFIEAQHSAAAQDCHLRQEELMEHLRKECGHVSLQGVRMQRAKQSNAAG